MLDGIDAIADGVRERLREFGALEFPMNAVDRNSATDIRDRQQRQRERFNIELQSDRLAVTNECNDLMLIGKTDFQSRLSARK